MTLTYFNAVGMEYASSKMWMLDNNSPNIAKNASYSNPETDSGSESALPVNTSPDYIVTPEGVLPTNKDYNLVSTSTPTNKGGEFLQIHNGHEHFGVENPHTHSPKVNTDPVSGRSNVDRLVNTTTAEDINYVDKMMREGILRERTNIRDKGGY